MSGATDDRSTAGAARSAVDGGFSRLVLGIRRRLARLYASDWVTVGLTLAVVLLVGGTLVGRRAAAFAMVAGGAMALVVALSNSSIPLVRATGGAAAVVAALVAVPSLALAGAFALAAGGIGLLAAVALLCLVLASFAAALAPTDAPGGGSVAAAARTTQLSSIGIVAVVAARILPETGARGLAVGAVRDAGEAFLALATQPSGGDALVTWLGLVALAAFVLRSALGRVPVERLLPPERRDAADGLLARLARILWTGSWAAGVGAVVAAIAPVVSSARPAGYAVTHVETIRSQLPAPAGDVVVDLLVAPGVRWALLGAFAASAVVVGVGRVWDSVRRGLARALARVLAPAAGGALMGVAAASLLADPSLPETLVDAAPSSVPPGVIDLLVSTPPFVAAGAALLAALSVLWFALTGIRLLGTLRILPRRATGPALAALALFGTAVVAALVAPAAVAVGTTVAALVVWDVGEFGSGLREELPAGTPTFRVEVVHAGGSLLTAGSIGGATLWAHGNVGGVLGVPDPQLAMVAVVTTAIAVALIAFALRG
jgi:hypothetical protein